MDMKNVYWIIVRITFIIYNQHITDKNHDSQQRGNGSTKNNTPHEPKNIGITS